MKPFEITPDDLPRLVDQFRDEVDTGWVDECLDAIDGGQPAADFGDGATLLEALHHRSETIYAMRNDFMPPYPEHVPVLGAIARVVAKAGELEGSERLFDDLRRRGEQKSKEGFRHFFNYLFEGEAAVFYSETLGSPVRFGEENPDLWVTGLKGFEIPVECKRLWQPGDRGIIPEKLQSCLVGDGRAYDQLRRALRKCRVESGIAAVRVAEPTSYSELWRADRAVRRTLGRNLQVAFVSLFWDRSFVRRGPWLYGPDGVPRRTHVQAFRVLDYVVRNGLARDDLTGRDDIVRYFPDGPPAGVEKE